MFREDPDTLMDGRFCHLHGRMDTGKMDLQWLGVPFFRQRKHTIGKRGNHTAPLVLEVTGLLSSTPLSHDEPPRQDRVLK